MTASLQYFSTLWSGVAPAVADHLWQSTLVAAVAGLLTLALRNNSARVRYSLWLAASLKFLIPFSLLVAVGSQFSWRHLSAAPASGTVLIQEFGQPFTQTSPLTRAAGPIAASTSQIHWLPVLLGLWLVGFLVVLGLWAARWWRVAAAIRESTPLTEGRELSALRRLKSLAGTPRPMDILLSRASLEPGVFGILRPVLLWPHSISEHLDDEHLSAVIAHELCHVRRRDNLAAVLHMLVEAVFWFHPLVWWMGARLIEERERACDEAVLELGGQRNVYAESILKVCEFCLSSPLTCVSGVTGSDLKKRMVHIMTDRVVRQLNFARKLLLWTAACLAIALPIVFGLFNATPSRAESQLSGSARFSSVSIKPHPVEKNGLFMTKMMMMVKGIDPPRFDVVGVSPHMLIRTAYRIQETQLTGEPEWTKTQRYDINATIDPQLAAQMQNMSESQRDAINQQMMRNFLADYFKLTVHQESRDLPVYELVVGESGSKLQKTSKIGMTRLGIGELDSQGAPMSILTTELSQRLGRTVIDKTGLQGNYDFTLHWTPDADETARIRATIGVAPLKGHEDMAAPPPSGPPLVTAVEEQLGLKLQPQTERVPVLIVDSIEQPSQN